MEIIKFTRSGLQGLALAIAVMFLAGCGTTDNFTPPQLDANLPVGGSATNSRANDSLAVGDRITVSFNDLTPQVQPIECVIKEDGSITLIYNKTFQAAGLNLGQLEKKIRDTYVPAIFVNMTPTVKSMDRFFYVGGEVRQPNRQVYIGKMTVLHAIDAAAGFTDFAKKTKVYVTRADGKRQIENCWKAIRHPDQEKDLEIFPGDQIYVPKRAF